MINVLKIEGFEGHQSSQLEFHPGINLIIGNSNDGKSSIIKSIRWISENSPSGDGFINHDLHYSYVRADFENGIIERKKSEKENRYIVDGKILDAVGQNVPEEAQKIMKYTNYNLQSQFDRFFLLQDSSGEVARKLNEIIDLQIMDQTIKNVKSKVHKKNQEVQNNENNIKKLKIEIDSYIWVDGADYDVSIIEKLSEKEQKLDEKMKKLKNYKIELQNNIEMIEKYENLEKIKIKNKKLNVQLSLLIEKKNVINNLNEYNLNLKKYNASLQKYKQLKNKKHDIANIQVQFDYFLKLVKKINKIKEMFDLLCTYSKCLQEYSKIKRIKTNILKLKNSVEKIKKNNSLIILLDNFLIYEKEKIKLKKNISFLKKEKIKFLSNIDFCPLCKQEILR